MTLRILLILGALSAFGPLAIDFYLPSFPMLARQFATDVEHVQLSLAAYFAGLAIGQLLYGPLADRFGRRRPLLVGVSLFALASLACAWAESLEVLVLARFVQALGGCAGMVISRAVVRDLCDPLASAKVFSQLILVMGVAPILAPLAGGWLLAWSGWPAIFYCLLLFAVLCALAIALWLPESRPAHAPPAPLSGALGQYRHLLADRAFLGHALTGGLAMAALFAFISGSPFVFIEHFGLSPQQMGLAFGLNVTGFMIGTTLSARHSRRLGPARLIRHGVWIGAACGVLLAALALASPQHPAAVMLPMWGVTAAIGLILPNATALGLAGYPKMAGAAASLMGFVQMGLGAGAGMLVGHGVQHGTSALGLTVAAGMLFALAAWSRSPAR